MLASHCERERGYPDGEEDIEGLIIESVVNFSLQVLDCFGFSCCVSFLDVFEYDDEVGGEGSQVKRTSCGGERRGGCKVSKESKRSQIGGPEGTSILLALLDI